MRVVRPAVYIPASRRNGTLYIGVTGDLASRISIHQQDLADGFTKRYSVHMLVHYEQFATMPEAVAREKRLKKFLRTAKLALIEASNPELRDLTSHVAAWRSETPFRIFRSQDRIAATLMSVGFCHCHGAAASDAAAKSAVTQAIAARAASRSRKNHSDGDRQAG